MRKGPRPPPTPASAPAVPVRHRRTGTILRYAACGERGSALAGGDFTGISGGQIREVGYKFGRWLDLILLQLILDTPQHPNEE